MTRGLMLSIWLKCTLFWYNLHFNFWTQTIIKGFDNHCCERKDNGEYSSPGFETTFKNQSAGKKERNKSNLHIYKVNLM